MCRDAEMSGCSWKPPLRYPSSYRAPDEFGLQALMDTAQWPFGPSGGSLRGRLRHFLPRRSAPPRQEPTAAAHTVSGLAAAHARWRWRWRWVPYRVCGLPEWALTDTLVGPLGSVRYRKSAMSHAGRTRLTNTHRPESGEPPAAHGPNPARGEQRHACTSRHPGHGGSQERGRRSGTLRRERRPAAHDRHRFARARDEAAGRGPDRGRLGTRQVLHNGLLPARRAPRNARVGTGQML